MRTRRYTEKEEDAAEKATNKQLGRERMEGLAGNTDDEWDNAYADALNDIDPRAFDISHQKAKHDHIMAMNKYIDKATRSDYE